MIEPFRLCVALLPLGIYLLLLGALNLTRRPRLTTGGRDVAALGLALTGFMVVGPLELFMPEAAAARFGGYVWLMLLAFYGLSLSLLVLLTRPRLIVYNIAAEELRPVLGDVIRNVDADARWAGDSLALPRLGVQLHVDGFPAMRNISLVASGDRQSFDGWRRLELALREGLQEVEVHRNPRGVSMVVGGLLLLACCVFQSLNDPQAVAQGMRDMLRL